VRVERLSPLRLTDAAESKMREVGGGVKGGQWGGRDKRMGEDNKPRVFVCLRGSESRE